VAEASVEYTAAGGNDFTVTFGYLKKSHVKLYIDGVEDQTFTWLDATSIAATTTPTPGATVLISRTTPRNALVYEIPDSGTYKGADLNNQALQALYVAAEGYDALDNTISLDTNDNKWDADSKIIKNVVDPVAAQDVATKNYTLTGEDSQLAAAAASASAAAASASSATSSASTASTAASTATSQASTASTAASTATTQASNAATSASNASDDAGYAEEWAVKAEDTLVSVAAGGDGATEYSSYHWAQKAAASATAAAASEASTAADTAGLALPSDPRDANELLRGEQGISMNFMARDYMVRDYASTLEDYGLLANAAPTGFTMTTNTGLTVTNRAGGTEALSANEMTWDHDTSGDPMVVRGLYHANGNHHFDGATIGSTFVLDETNFTLFYEFELYSTADAIMVTVYATSNVTDSVILRISSGNIIAQIYSGTVQQASLNLGAAVTTGPIKCAIAHRDGAGCWGISDRITSVQTDATVTTPAAAFTNMTIGDATYGWSRRLFFIDRAMSQDEIKSVCGVT